VTPALGVQRPREDALARAALAAQEDRRVGAGGARDDVERRAHHGRVGGEVGLGHLVGQLRLELRDAQGRRAAHRDALDGVPDLRGREGLGHVVDGAALDRVDGRVDGRVGGDHDDLQLRARGQEAR